MPSSDKYDTPSPSSPQPNDINNGSLTRTQEGQYHGPSQSSFQSTKAPGEAAVRVVTPTAVTSSSSTSNLIKKEMYRVQQQPQPVSALALLQERYRRRQQNKRRPCLLQHPNLALEIGTITQLYGPAGSGKTQLALSTCVDCVLLRQQQVVYVGLGGSNILGIVPRRLQSMIKSRLLLRLVAEQQQQPQHQGSQTTQKKSSSSSSSSMEDIDATVKYYLSNIFLHWVSNEEDLLEVVAAGGSLQRCLHVLAPKVSLVVLDGISNLLRLPDTQDLPSSHFCQERATLFFQLSSRLKLLSSMFQVPILIVNGATTKIMTYAGEKSLEPALGLSWNQCVNSTYFIGRRPGGYYDSTHVGVADDENGDTSQHQSQQATTGSSSVVRRILRCKKSPLNRSEESIDFYIDSGGTFPIR